MNTYFEFTDLIVWQKSHFLVLEIYKICSLLPTTEQYGLAQQLRRSAVSITSNISEGFGRRSKKEKLYFYNIAHGSVNEVHNQLILMRDLKYSKTDESELLIEKIKESKKLIKSLIKSTSNFI